MLETAEGLSLNRIGNISKNHTSLNVSQDFKEQVKRILETEIRQMTKELDRQVRSLAPDSKSLLNLETPQLSLHRVKGLKCPLKLNYFTGIDSCCGNFGN